MQNIDDYARDAIDDLVDSILDTIRGIPKDDLSGDFVSQIEQYLRVKILYPYEGDNLERDVKRVFIRMIEMLN